MSADTLTRKERNPALQSFNSGHRFGTIGLGDALAQIFGDQRQERQRAFNMIPKGPQVWESVGQQRPSPFSKMLEAILSPTVTVGVSATQLELSHIVVSRRTERTQVEFLGIVFSEIVTREFMVEIRPEFTTRRSQIIDRILQVIADLMEKPLTASSIKVVGDELREAVTPVRVKVTITIVDGLVRRELSLAKPFDEEQRERLYDCGA